MRFYLMKVTKLGIRKWLSFIVAGLIGQLAWAIENNYLNVFIHDVTGLYFPFIPLMVALSAIAATVTTLLMGALSDRLGKRKIFIAAGYIIWGVSIVLFAFMDRNQPYSFIPVNAIYLSGSLIVVLDCLMTFFGSTANDAAFNAFVTDNTEESNRGKVESVLSILPLVAMIAVVLLQGFLVNNDTKDWLWFFVVFGGLTTLSGVGLLFLLPKDNIVPNKEEPYFKNIVHGFRPSVIKSRPELYLALTAFMIFNIGIQVFLPYFMVYVQEIRRFELVSTAGPILGVACVLTVCVGVFMEKIGKYKVVFSALGATVVGGVLLFALVDQISVIIGGIILMSGYLLATAVLGAKIRDYTPEKETGLFQGVRMVFVVMIPMVTGPYMGQAVSSTYTDSLGNPGAVEPSPNIFILAAAVMVLVIIPLIFLIRKEKANKKTEVVENEQAAE